MANRDAQTSQTARPPKILGVGMAGLLVSFADELSDTANRAALAFRTHIDELSIDGVIETSLSLTSAFVSFDLDRITHERVNDILSEAVSSRDWMTAELPSNRTLWHIPTAYGGNLGPQLAEAADLAGQSEADAIETFSTTRVRVLTLGFAPGQPYLGTLPASWNIPRQTGLTAKVPKGALTTAISQFVLFTVEAPTGWRHIGQTAFDGFQPTARDPFLLKPGDEVVFSAVSEAEFTRLKSSGDPNGGATCEDIA